MPATRQARTSRRAFPPLRLQAPTGRALIRTEYAISADIFTVGDERTIYEWCMIYTDRHPGVATLHATTAHQQERLLHLGAIAPLIAGAFTADTPGGDFEVDTTAHYRVANAVYQELATAIQTGSLEPKRRVYLEDRPGELDLTLCVLDAEPILEIAERRGDGGVIIQKLLAERRQPAALASPRRRRQYIGALSEWLAPKHIDILRRTSPNALARDFKLYCERERQEVLPLLPKRLRSMERTIEQIIEGRVNAAKVAAAKTRAGIAQ
jgi:hypothetical protein